MKTLLLLIILPFSFLPAVAQQTETLISGDVRHGGFGGPVVKFDSINNEFGVWVGGRGGWFIGIDDVHALSIGGGGYGLVTEHLAPNPQEANQNIATIGHGGFEIEYYNRYNQLIHFTVGTHIGAGGITLRDGNENVSDSNQVFFVFEPGINAELNVTHFFRIMLGFNYRLTSGIDFGGFSDKDFSGPLSTLTFKFGSF